MAGARATQAGISPKLLAVSLALSAGDIKVEKLAALGDKLNIDALKQVTKALKKSSAPKE